MRLLRTLLCCCLAVAASAAVIDCSFPAIRDTSLATTLGETLALPAQEGVEAIDPVRDCERVLITWNGVKSPPVVRFKGVPARALMERYAAAGAPVDSQYGAAYPLPQRAGLAAVALSDDELLVASPKIIGALEAPAWPEARGNILDFSGPASDLKLGDLQEELKQFHFVWGQDGKLVLRATANSKTDAKAVLRYIALRKPLVEAAADVGIEKAEFPAKLLGSSKFERDDNKVIARMDLDATTRTEAVDYLAKAVTKQMRKYQ